MKSGEGFGESFVVPCQPAEAGCPSNASLHHPAAGQQHETTFGLRLFDYFQLYAVLFSRLSRAFPGIALIHISQFDVLASDFLHRLGQLLHLGAILFIGCGHVQGEQMTQRVHRRMYFRSLSALSTVVARSCA